VSRQSFQPTDGDASYANIYPELLKGIKTLTDTHGDNGLEAMALMVYGWMPRILGHITLKHFGCEKGQITDTIRTITSIEQGRTYIGEQMAATPPINNSWVGTSKLLHCLNPEIFPIWDSRIATKLGYKNRHNYERKSAYLDYMDWIETVCQHPVADELVAHFGNACTKVRAVEFALFMAKD
jgi:hypothetical protein